MMNRFKNRFISSFTIATVVLLLFSGIASAHVTVSPGVSSPGAWETYSIKIPVEKDIPTVKISLEIPSGMEFQQYRPVPDWTVDLVKNDTGLITMITWSAEGNGIQPGQFQQFEFVAKNPKEESHLAWDAYQYYSDGSIVEWTGSENEKNPHSITMVTTETGTEMTGGHNHTSGSASSGNTATPATEATQGGSTAAGTTSIVLSSVALLMALIAFWISLRSAKKST
ncbi:uncharacterized protein YcnI [Paenibacillus anaericanus]|uniref:YcnI family copper-binding membrane protein n=1 Tax=Paenibacillus anaericanus TaxID=170367 RepID=UPI0027814B11|nr:YcnI family protein [Paenibacillus anaericanus]MDQ0089360.1 uncharacterized protein YcnI [Paenibacillus anaericanus]